MTLLEELLSRRSVLANNMQSPGPDGDQIRKILEAAHRVPDHGKIGPWRFVLFEGENRIHFGKKLRAIFKEDNPDASDKLLDFEEQRFNRAPLIIAVISSPVEHKVPEWEQVLSAGAACQNILLAAKSMGFGAQWLTEWYAFHPKVDALFGLKDKDKIAGFMYIGSYAEAPTERVRPDLAERIQYWSPALHA